MPDSNGKFRGFTGTGWLPPDMLKPTEPDPSIWAKACQKALELAAIKRRNRP